MSRDLSKAPEAVASMCEGKDSMPRHVARRVAKRMARTRKAPLEHYKCPICKGWHVGKKPECAFRDHPITGSDNIRSVIPI
jgi:hypothetical protein